MPLPPLVRLLDPRPLDEAKERPIADSVSIPLNELPGRMNELCPRHGTISVPNIQPFAPHAVEFFAANGREVRICEDWCFGSTTPARLWSPNPFLIEVAERLAPGNALDLACGVGRDAVALAGMGWHVTAVDHLDDALKIGANLAQRYLEPEETERIVWDCVDLENDPFAPKQRFDLITMCWYLNRDLIRQAVELLNPGGSLVVETFTSVHRNRFGKPRREGFVLQQGELFELAEGLTFRCHEENWHSDRHSARLWATRKL